MKEKSTLKRNIEFSFLTSTKFSPWIRKINLEEEYFILYNPEQEDFDLSSCKACDEQRYHNRQFFCFETDYLTYHDTLRRKHIFVFPEGTIIKGKSDLYVYTCPGKSHFSSQEAQFQEPNVKWLNQDGTFRKKEILNNGK